MTRIDLFWTRQSQLIMISIFWARNNLVMKSSTCSKEYGLHDRFFVFCFYFFYLLSLKLILRAMHKVCAEKPKACFVMNRDRKQVIKHEEFFLRKVFATEIIRRRAA